MESLKYVSEKLQNNIISLEYANKEPNDIESLKYEFEELQNDFESFKYTYEKLQNNHNILLEAIKQDGLEFKNNYDVILEVKQYGKSLEYASK